MNYLQLNIARKEKIITPEVLPLSRSRCAALVLYFCSASAVELLRYRVGNQSADPKTVFVRPSRITVSLSLFLFAVNLSSHAWREIVLFGMPTTALWPNNITGAVSCSLPARTP